MILVLLEETGMRDLTKKQRYWQGHLAALEEFDGSAAEYARLHGLQAKQLYVYKTKLRACAQRVETSFVQVTTASLSMRSGVTVSLPNGVRLSLPNLEAPGLLERLFRL